MAKTAHISFVFAAQSFRQTIQQLNDAFGKLMPAMPAHHPNDPMHQELYKLIDLIKNGDAFLSRVDRDINVSMGNAPEEIWHFEVFVPLKGALPTAFGGGLSLSISPPKKVKKVEDIGTSIEPIIAYRDFFLGGAYREPYLLSRNDALWPYREPMRAECRKNEPYHATHDAPEIGCECGIYAFDTPTHEDMALDSMAWGEVYLWGETLICESGYRAEFAYPKNIFIRDTGTKVIRAGASKLQELYGVPVILMKERDGLTMSEIFDQSLDRWRGGVDL